MSIVFNGLWETKARKLKVSKVGGSKSNIERWANKNWWQDNDVRVIVHNHIYKHSCQSGTLEVSLLYDLRWIWWTLLSNCWTTYIYKAHLTSRCFVTKIHVWFIFTHICKAALPIAMFWRHDRSPRLLLVLLLLWMLLGFPDLDAERCFCQFPNVEIFWSDFCCWNIFGQCLIVEKLVF